MPNRRPFARSPISNLRVDGLVRNAVLQGLALQVLHDNERPVFVFANFVDRADIRMIERRGRSRFPPEALQQLRVVRRLLGKELQRHAAAKHLYVLRLKYFSHPASSHKAYDLKSPGYHGARGESLRLGNLNRGLTQKAPGLLVIPQELLDLFSHILFRAGHS